MGELAHWNLTVSRDTDAALRTLLAERGGGEADLSRFVEQVVNRELLWLTVDEIRARNAGLDADEVARLIDEELEAIRPTFWTNARR